MSSGFIALLDDITTLAKVAASSIDDAGAMAMKAGSKATGIVIDDAAVTPRYVVGLAADRELPIIIKIARGSLKNKLLILLPGALVLSIAAPWSITPLLMAGGAFLCMEGFHKVVDLIRPDHHGSEAGPGEVLSLAELEKERVGSAIRTDFILSAEIMAITLAGVTSSPLWMRAVVLAIVGLGMTLLVYGAVALIVKADDAGVALTRSRAGILRAAGRAVVAGMPAFLKVLSFVGMVAMLWVGCGILTHGLHELGVHGPEKTVHHAAEWFGSLLPAARGLFTWLGQTGLLAASGVIVGALVELVARYVLKPAFARLRKKQPA